MYGCHPCLVRKDELAVSFIDIGIAYEKASPRSPIPYITIIDHLTHDAAMAHAAVLMSTMSRTLDAYRAFPLTTAPWS
jgi:hypothetical protein